LERLLAQLLQYGTWLASAVIALGLALATVPGVEGKGTPAAAAFSGMHIVTAGIALFILLPVLRVTVMLTVYLRERDYRLGAIAALVLLIIFAGFALGAAHVMA
jgi:uncharacterized membrane protein